jgi:uncharacterized protein
MIAVDTNLLIHAHRFESTFHQQAKKLLCDLAEGSATWAIPWPCVHEFYGIVTHPNRFKPASSVEEGITQLVFWKESPSLRMIGEGPQHLQLLAELLHKGKVIGPMVHDARIAAICIAHGVREFWTLDRDFSRFPQLRCRNPLVEA